MELDACLGHIDADGAALVDAALAAGYDAEVPGCPDWTVRDLVVHVGGVHRWAADHVANARTGFDSDAGDAVGTGPADDELAAWANAGRAELLQTLRKAPHDLACATFVATPSALEFWARRQAHETAIHRADAQAAAGQTPSFEPAFAIDGIGEILEVFASRRKGFEAGTLRLAPDGQPPIDVTLTETGALVGDIDGEPEVTISGTPTDVYLWLWQRPSTIGIDGPEAAAERWKKLRVRWS